MIGESTYGQMREAAKHLAASERGRSAMQHLLEWLDSDGLSLDSNDQGAVLVLLAGAWGSWPGSARDEMRQAMGSDNVY